MLTCFPLGVVDLAGGVVQVKILAGVEEVQLVLQDQGVVRGTESGAPGKAWKPRSLAVLLLEGLDGAVGVLEEDEGAVGRETGTDLALVVDRRWFDAVKLALLSSFFAVVISFIRPLFALRAFNLARGWVVHGELENIRLIDVETEKSLGP